MQMEHTPSGANFTKLILETFRLNGTLIAAGDQLVCDLGLTSARWQVLGGVCESSATVAEIARRMGLTRQNVQRIADCLAMDGFVATSANPAHRRAKLYSLTPHGRTVMEEVAHRQAEWANRIADGISSTQIVEAVSLMTALTKRLEHDLPRRK
ncbi:MarR family winged helix-turn-helix transcriptional regulator [Geomesophilobacter sediminis]|uniref:Winged helix-turn-helix transcriptional regulator n=1 Tax=Geomesophilobacter sediminis TaxID=2798584 RepID=A0A8J7M0Q5_9BACT|nr:MarR family winged helix-turn-helix transcriptional regulator [Geomesophilobacter sediminis]MBJ6726417.1 winged helix-turn-helix transcriptional regulator [Geomesophilobacter sediminis]